VAARWKEYGVRLALGGSVGSLHAALIRKTAKMLALGLLLGAFAVIGSADLLGSAVAGLQPSRPATALITAGLLALSAFAAILWPLLRLAKVDPVTALRHE
jgi:putative ABC transport system permease protein